MPTDTDWAYLAGMIDGDGHVQANRNKHVVDGRGRRQISISVTQANHHSVVIDHLHTIFGGRVYSQGANAIMWRVGSASALRPVLMHLLPYIVLKKPDIIEALYLLDETDEYLKLKQLGLTFGVTV